MFNIHSFVLLGIPPLLFYARAGAWISIAHITARFYVKEFFFLIEERWLLFIDWLDFWSTTGPVLFPGIDHPSLLSAMPPDRDAVVTCERTAGYEIVCWSQSLAKNLELFDNVLSISLVKNMLKHLAQLSRCLEIVSSWPCQLRSLAVL